MHQNAAECFHDGVVIAYKSLTIEAEQQSVEIPSLTLEAYESFAAQFNFRGGDTIYFQNRGHDMLTTEKNRLINLLNGYETMLNKHLEIPEPASCLVYAGGIITADFISQQLFLDNLISLSKNVN